MTVNEWKTDVMFPGSKTPKVSSIKIGRSRVKIKKKVRCLGIDIDRLGSIVGHAKMRSGIAKHRLRRLAPLLRLDSGVNLSTRVMILKALAQPIAFYGAEIAVKGSEAARKILSTTHRVLIRKCLGAPWFVPNRVLAEAAGVENILEVAAENRKKRIETIRNHANSRV